MPTKDDLERARQAGYEQGVAAARIEATQRAEKEAGYPPRVACLLALIDGLHARGVSHNDLHQIVVAYLDAEARARKGET